MKLAPKITDRLALSIGIFGFFIPVLYFNGLNEWYDYGVLILIIGYAVLLVTRQLPGCMFLEFDNEKLLLSHLYRKTVYLWSDIENFETLNISGNKMVGINFNENFKKQVIARKVSKSMSGCDGALPDTYGMKVEDLCDLLNEHLLTKKG